MMNYPASWWSSSMMMIYPACWLWPSNMIRSIQQVDANLTQHAEVLPRMLVTYPIRYPKQHNPASCSNLFIYIYFFYWRLAVFVICIPLSLLPSGQRDEHHTRWHPPTDAGLEPETFRQQSGALPLNHRSSTLQQVSSWPNQVDNLPSMLRMTSQKGRPKELVSDRQTASRSRVIIS